MQLLDIEQTTELSTNNIKFESVENIKRYNVREYDFLMSDKQETMPTIHELKGKEKQEFRNALVSAFTTEQKLNEMVEVVFNKRLNQIVSSGNIEHQIFELISWSISQGKLETLIQGALDENPDNIELKSFLEKFNITSNNLKTENDVQEDNTSIDDSLHSVSDINTTIKNNNELKERNTPIIKILFMTSHPIDQTRLSSEFDNIRNKVKSSINKGELNFLNPTWETDYEAFLTRLKEDKPNVIHYSGHSDKTGICLKNSVTGKTQFLENDELIDIFELRTSYLKLVLLNSCFSAAQAEIISDQGIYVLGLEDEIEDNLANKLAERFYLGFIVQEIPISITKAIKFGCTNFIKTYPEHKNLISLWKDGKKINYKHL